MTFPAPDLSRPGSGTVASAMEFRVDGGKTGSGPEKEDCGVACLDGLELSAEPVQAMARTAPINLIATTPRSRYGVVVGKI